MGSLAMMMTSNLLPFNGGYVESRYSDEHFGGIVIASVF